MRRIPKWLYTPTCQKILKTRTMQKSTNTKGGAIIAVVLLTKGTCDGSRRTIYSGQLEVRINARDRLQAHFSAQRQPTRTIFSSVYGDVGQDHWKVHPIPLADMSSFLSLRTQ